MRLPPPEKPKKEPLPVWAQDGPLAALQAMLLAGAWDPASQNGEDAAILTLLGSDLVAVGTLCEKGMAAGELRYERRRMFPLGESGQSWRWVDAKAAWRRLAHTLDIAACDRFAQACQAVLSGQGSPTMRRGVAFSLALFGNSDGRIAVAPTPSIRAAQIVEGVLPAKSEQWKHLLDFLQLLAEAAPEAFLLCVERIAAAVDGGAAIWQAADEAVVYAIARVLALLALDVKLLPRVTLLLARLANKLPLPKSNVRDSHPLQVLEEIFAPEWPKTNATIEERLAVLERLWHAEPQTAWNLFLLLFETGGMVVLNVPRPAVMRIAVPSQQRSVSSAAVYGQQETLLQWAMGLAGNDGERWAALLRRESDLFEELFIVLLRNLEARGAKHLRDGQALWEALRASLSKFSPVPQPTEANQSGSPARKRGRRQQQRETLARSLYQQLTPANFVEAHAWLFGERPTIPVHYTSIEEHHALLRDERQACIAALCEAPDRWELLAGLAKRTQNISLLSQMLAQSGWGDELEQEFFRLHKLEPRFAVCFLAYRVGRREFSIIESWLRRLAVDGHTSAVTLLAQLLTGDSPTRDAQLWDLIDEFGDPIRRDYWLRIAVHQIAVPMPSSSTARVIDRFMEAANWDAARTAAIVFKEPATVAQRLLLLRRARESVQNDDGTRYREAMLWAELWDKIEPQGTEETLLARQEEVAWMRALRETYYRLRFVPPWITDEPQSFVELATSPSGQFLPRLWQGWPGDTLPAEAAHEFMYNWARAVLSYSKGPEGRKVVCALLVQILRRPRGADGLWPGDALRRLLEEEFARGGDVLADNLRSYGRAEPSHQARIVGELAQRDQDLAADCERSARELALRWPRTAALCNELAASYRQAVADWQERSTMWNERDGLVSPSENVEPLFPLTELQVENFRGIAHAPLFPLHPRLNVLYGRNASGKSTLLDALRIGLAALVPKLPPNINEKIGELPKIYDRDRRISAESLEPAPYVRITLSGQRYQDEPLVWQVERDYARGAEAQDRETASLVPYFDALNARLGSSDPSAPLPVFAFYGSQRVPSSKAEEPATPSDERRTRADGLADALKGVASFEPGTDWFRREWFKELQERSEQAGYESPPLRAIRKALAATLMTPEGVGIKNPRIAKGTLLFVVDFVRPGQKDLRLEIGQLSDGFRTLLMMVIDLMRRIVESNPAFPDEQDPTERWRNIPAVVLIDEVDAHLHPSWQKTVLRGMLAAFPRSQFFVTTHSPLVLAAEHDATTWLLEDGKVSTVGQTYGKTPDVILEDYQDTPVRPVELQKKLDSTRTLIQQGDLDGAEALIAQLETEIEPERPELVALRTRLQFARDRAPRHAPPEEKRSV